MRAAARIVAVADGARGTRLAELRGEAPLLVRRTSPIRDVGGPDGAPAGGNGGEGGLPGEVQVHLVGGAAGPLGGDRLRIEIEVGAGALLCVRTVAASLALPGAGGEQSQLTVTARVEAGGRLRWLPEPLIGAARCDHLARSVLDLAAGARLVWREELICGRHGEPVGDVRISTAVRYAGRTLLRNELSVGPRATGWSGPARLGGGRVAGSLLVVDPAWADTGPPGPMLLGPVPPGPGSTGPGSTGPGSTGPGSTGPGSTGPGSTGPVPPRPVLLRSSAALLPLAGGPAVLVTATGTDPGAVRDALDELPRMAAASRAAEGSDRRRHGAAV